MKTAAELVLLEEEAKGNLRVREFTSTLMTRLDVFLYNAECKFMKETNCRYEMKMTIWLRSSEFQKNQMKLNLYA